VSVQHAGRGETLQRSERIITRLTALGTQTLCLDPGHRKLQQSKEHKRIS